VAAWISLTELAVPPSTWPSRPPPATRRTASPASGTVPGAYHHPPGRHGRRTQQGGQPRLPQVQYLGRTGIHLAVTAAARNKENSLAFLRYGTWSVPPSTWPSRLPPATRRTASPASGKVAGGPAGPPTPATKRTGTGTVPDRPREVGRNQAVPSSI
jgi:hypothetical protein